MLGKQTNTLQAVSGCWIWQAVSPVWRTLRNKGPDLSFVLLFAIAEAATEEILGKLVETEAWLILDMEKGNTHQPAKHTICSPHCSCRQLAPSPCCTPNLSSASASHRRGTQDSSVPHPKPAISQHTHQFFFTD